MTSTQTESRCIEEVFSLFLRFSVKKADFETALSTFAGDDSILRLLFSLPMTRVN